MNKKISVIIPVYNAAKTLSKTIESLTNQTYKNLEIILINDGSTDDSLKICQEYAQKDIRIIVVNQKNSGVSAARNYGITISTGYFISFVDSDDILESNYFMELYNSFKLTDADMVISNVKCITNNGSFYPYNDINTKKEYSRKEFLKLLLNFKIGNAVWGKLFKKECVKNLKFEDFNINEDFIFFWNASLSSNKFFLNFNTYYGYCIDTELSLSKQVFNKENMSIIKHIDSVKKYINNNYPDLIEDATNYYNAYLLHNLVLYYKYLSSDNLDNLYLNEVQYMIYKLKNVEKISNTFLVSEQDINIKTLVSNIKKRIGR